jgi:hypothetical protein
MPLRRTLLTLLLCASAAWGVDLKNLKEEVITGDLAGISDKEIVIQRGADKVFTPIDQAVLLTFGQQVGTLPNVPWSDVELTDGTVLHCAQFTIVKDEVRVTLLAGQEVKFPLSALANMVANAHVEKNKKDWAEIMETKRPRDVLVINNDGVANPVEGTLGVTDGTGETIHFTRTNGKEVDFSMKKVFGLIFDRKPDPAAPPVACRLFDTHRNVVVVAKAESTPTGFAVTTPSGARIDYTTTLVVRMDYSKGKVDYLSDLNPVKEESKFDGNDEKSTQRFPYQKDLNLARKPLRVNNVEYSKGLAVHAYTALVYDLKGDYRELKLTAGIDDDYLQLFNRPVQLVIEGDGAELARVVITPKDKDKWTQITRNIKDVKKLRIAVSRVQGDAPFDFGINLDLADVKVSK